MKFKLEIRKSLIIMLTVFFFAVVSVFGISLLTGNNQQSGVGSSSASAQEPADINNDNTVNVFDLSYLLGKWNTNDSTADLNKDSTVNVFDLSMLLGKWGAVGGTTCTVSDKLVNSCRPWLGATVARYPNIGDSSGYDYALQFDHFNKRLNDPSVLNDPNKQVNITKLPDFVHVYRTNNQTLSTYMKSIASSGNQYLQLNFKPKTGAGGWAASDGRDATVNANIDAMANSIKSVAPNKVMLSIYHEPENDVTVGSAGGSCTTKGDAGTPADYRNMWANVRARFNALGVTNVVWAMNYMGFSNWNCLVSQLWPGNELVDWVLWDPYDGDQPEYTKVMKEFYTWLENNSDSTHNYISKYWGFGEFGYWNQSGDSTDANSVIFWQQAKQAILDDSMPRVKLYSVYDTTASNPLDYAKGSFVGLQFNSTPTPDLNKQAAFNDFSQTLLNIK